ncbi:MAG: GntR family transcriptional regulator [Chitinivibrionales bacterium]|nr:GntR family transcriptional regulator [Chitinivibrionales bacterium]
MRISPGIKKAIESVFTEISSGRISPGDRLPGIPRLAQSSGVSPVTMWKAMNILREKGIVEGIRGNPFIVTSDALQKIGVFKSTLNEPVQKVRSSCLWQRIRLRLLKDVLNGVYGSNGVLPTLKELRQKYGISFRPLKKALTALCEEGVLAPRNRLYHVVSLSSSRSNSCVRVIMLSDQEKKLWAGSLNEECIRTLESECSRANVELQVVGYMESGKFFFARSDERLRPISTLSDDDSVLGYLYIVIQNDECRDIFLRRLSSFGKPVAVLDVVGGWELPLYAQKPYVKHFTTAISPLPGEIAARYLLEMGHRKVAYISPFHQAAWSKNRLAGIRKIFAGAGYDSAVTSCTWNNPPDIHSSYHDDALKNCPIEPLVEFFNKWKKDIPRFYINRMDSYFNFQLQWRILTIAEFNRQLHSLFDAALADDSVTVWVAANDTVALAAIEYLDLNEIEVPESISLISFDDTWESLRQGITSYNFNMQAVVHTMLGYVLNTRSVKSMGFYRPVEIEGMIIERMTTGKMQLKE